MFEPMQQGEQIAASFTGVAVDTMDGIIQFDRQVAILTVGTTVVKHALHAMLT